jgi:hypothetical protein
MQTLRAPKVLIFNRAGVAHDIVLCLSRLFSVKFQYDKHASTGCNPKRNLVNLSVELTKIL